MSQQPIQPPPQRPRRPRGQPGARRPLRERILHPQIDRPEFTPRRRKALAWVAGVLALLAIAIAVLFAVWDWNWFKGPIERLASARLHRQVTIAGDLNARIWSWQPSATADGIFIANPAWARTGPGTDKLGSIGRLTVKIRLLPLLSGHLDLRRVAVDQPHFALLADGNGRRNWDFSNGVKQAPMKLPPIRSFLIRDGHLSYLDTVREIRFRGTINAREHLGERHRGFELVGDGTINTAPFHAEITGGPLLNIERDRPYPFDADIRAGRTYITAKGAVPKPFDLGRFYMDATARGPDMAQLFPLTGVALPNTPPYNLKGRLSRDDEVWRVDGLSGRVGDSDMAGAVAVTVRKPRPVLKANLVSRRLDFDDLGAIFGAAPKAGKGETASPEQAAMAARLKAEHRVIPDAPLDMRRIRAMDADVTYRAASIRDAPVNLSSGSVRVRLDDGLLRADPLSVQMPRGKVEGHVNLNARGATPVSEMDLRLTNARIETLVPVTYDGSPPVTGAIVGHARLTGAGNSLHKAFAAANGQVTVAAPGGEIRKAFAELAGTNVIKGLGLLHKTDTTPVRCAVANFRTRNGVMTADNIVLDTGPVLITGSGTIDLGRETLDVRMQGHDKKFRFGRVTLPVRAQGPITAPNLSVEPGKAILQGGAALTLGSVLSPLALVLPFIDPGLAKDANCGALLAEAGQLGAPLKSAAPLTAKR